MAENNLEIKVIFRDKDDLEGYGFFTKLVRVITVPLLNTLPSFFVKKIMKTTSNDAEMIIENVGSSHALEVMYTRYKRNLFARGFWYGLGNLFWHHILAQSRAVRNRLKIVEESLGKALIKLDEINKTKNKKRIIILTVGGGSARGIIETVNRLSKRGISSKIEVINLDKSKKAIELGKKLAEEFGVSESFKWLNNTASNIKFLIPEKSIDIVEMVGLLDYFSDEKALRVMRQIYGCLKKNGFFITGNIYPNSEMRFISKIGWPEMFYRRESDAARILRNAGFSLKKGEIILEPLKSHFVVMIQK